MQWSIPQNAGVHVFAIGISNNVDTDELRVLVDRSEDMIIARSFADLVPIVKGLVKITCRRAGMYVLMHARNMYTKCMFKMFKHGASL